MDIETLARVLHEAGREAVTKGATVAAGNLGDKARKFLEWDEISKDARQGRRIQAAYLLNRYGLIERERGNGLPRWKCHKVVEAFKIEEVFRGHGTWGVALNGDTGEHVEKDNEWVAKHNPQTGGYYVRYEDGYESFSPAEAFESGYTLIRDCTPEKTFRKSALTVVYTGGIQADLDVAIEEVLRPLGLHRWASGMDFTTGKRDLAFGFKKDLHSSTGKATQVTQPPAGGMDANCDTCRLSKPEVRP